MLKAQVKQLSKVSSYLLGNEITNGWDINAQPFFYKGGQLS